MNATKPQWEFLARAWAMLLVGLPLFFAVAMFLPAGTWAWTRGWVFVAVFMAAALIVSLWLWRVNPEIYVARSRFHKGTKRWDLMLLGLLLPAMVAICVVAALDDGRFHWHPVPDWVCAIGYVLLLVGFGLSAWAEAVNKFFEPTVRIQTDRGHTVVQNGPYALVRHPGYVGAVLMFVGVSLALGSLWGLVPAALVSALLILRTRWEDQTLLTELPGYREYAARVRYRLIPSVW